MPPGWQTHFSGEIFGFSPDRPLGNLRTRKGYGTDLSTQTGAKMTAGANLIDNKIRTPRGYASFPRSSSAFLNTLTADPNLFRVWQSTILTLRGKRRAPKLNLEV